VIKSFSHKGLETLFRTGSAKGVETPLAPKLQRILSHLNDGPLPDAMNMPGYKLHPLKGQRKGEPVVWSVSVNGNWRVLFEIEDEDATHVNLVDYH
jgi:toxin HigB-1